MTRPIFDLQPMSIGDILDRSVRVYQRSFLHTLGIVAIPYLLLVPVGMAFGSALLVRPNLEALRNPGVIAGAVLLALAVSVVFIWLNFVSMGALSRSVSEHYLGRTPSIRTSYAPVLRRGGSLIWAYFLSFLVGAGVLALAVVLPMVGAVLVIKAPGWGIAAFLLFGVVAIVGGITAVRFWLRMLLVTQVIVIEDVRGTEALRRSWKLMRGNETRTVVITLFGAVVGYIVSLVLRLPTSILVGLSPGLGTRVLDAVVGGMAQVISTPFVSIPFTLLYYDSRIRQEAFDLEMMAQNLGAPGAPAAPTPRAAGPAPPGIAETLRRPGPAGPPSPMPRPASRVPVAPSGPAPTAAAPASSPEPPAGPRRSIGAFKVCPQCGAQVPNVRPNCPSCGTRVPFRPAGQ